MIERAAKRAAIGVALLRAAGNRAVRYRAGGNRAAAPPPAKDQAEEKPAGWNPNAGAPQPDRAGANGTVPLNDSVPQNSAVLPAADAAATAAPAADIPRWLRVTAGWAWRLLLLAALLYVAGKVAALLYVVIVPFAAAVLLTALLQPLAARLRRSGLGPLGATWCTLLLAFALIGGAVWLVTTRVEAEYPALVNQVRRTSTQIQHWLASSPLHVRTGSLTKISDDFVNFLSQHRSTVEGAALTGGKIVVELLAGLVLCFFISFFLIKDGERIWSWLVSGLSGDRGRRANLAGHAAWQAIVYYVRGTVAVAAIQAVVMGITLSIIGSPLVVPLALFMFIAAFIPLAGVRIAGTFAILIVLAAKGLIAAVIVLVVMVVMNQLEGHLLQPQVVGKMVRLHPLAVILVLAVAGVVAGIAGAVVAVPITAALTNAARALKHDTGHHDTGVPHAAAAPPDDAGNRLPAHGGDRAQQSVGSEVSGQSEGDTADDHR
jgi:predicted PurR-regulated permease PerM